MHKRTCTTVVRAAQLLALAPTHGGVIEDGAVAIDGARIVALDAAADVLAAWQPDNLVHLPQHVIMPGLINTHGHAAMTLLRGLGDGYRLQQWLRDVIWPAEAQHADAAFVADGVDLALVEMLRNGITTFSDMYFFPEVCAERAKRAGMRAQVAFPVIDLPNAWSASADDGISQGLALHDAYRNDPLIDIAFGPHSTYTVSRTSLERMRTYADELESAVQIHLHENADEVSPDSAYWNGARPLQLLDDIGLLGPRLQAVHMTQLLPAEIERLAETGVVVSHCPASNMKLASGICPLAALRAAGVPVGLGSDGAASNDALNLFQEARLATLLAKLQDGADALTAVQALGLATHGGARVLGMETEVGSLDVGKQADIIAIDLTAPSLQPLHDTATQLLHGAGNYNVTDVWVAGRRLLNNGDLLTLDDADVLARAARWRSKLKH